MGMYDTITFSDWERWFPDSEINFLFDSEWQTKSLENSLSGFLIDEDGNLYRRHFQENDTYKYDSYYFHGEILAYAYESESETDDENITVNYNSAEIKLVFTKGLLESVEVLSCEKNKKEQIRRRNLVDHIKDVVNVNSIKIPTCFMVYGFDITEQENKKWSITRMSMFSIMKDYSLKEGVWAEYESYKEAYNHLIQFFIKVKQNKLTHPLLEKEI